jgi:hypothetical protein
MCKVRDKMSAANPLSEAAESRTYISVRIHVASTLSLDPQLANRTHHHETD